MSNLDHTIGQRFVVGFHGLTAPDYILEWLQSSRIGGVILFARNVQSPQQLADLTSTLHAASPTPILIGIDQEGGMVARLRQKQGFTESPGAMALAAAPDNIALTEKISRLLADEMRALGINWTYAPVLDLSYNAANPTVGTRSFGANPVAVGALASAATRGFQSGNVIACAKHFPGLGNTDVDTHLELPTLDTPLDQLIAEDLEPYRHVIDTGVDSIMTTHTIFRALDEDHPATLSPVIIQRLLREELGYKGVIATDCLEMQAITRHYSEGEAAIHAIQAGVDILLISHTQAHQILAYDTVAAAAREGQFDQSALEAAHARIMDLKTRYALTLDEIDPSIIGSAGHIAQSVEAAGAGISLWGNLPDPTGKRIGVIEFASYIDSEVLERNDPTSLLRALQNQLPQVQGVALHASQPTTTQIDAARELAHRVDVLIVATRNAHINTSQKALAQQLLTDAGQSILIALRNPYDADVLDADAILCTFGDSQPSISAMAQVLAGKLRPTGQRPAVAEV